MSYQQPVVSEKNLHVGSVKVEVGPDTDSLVSLGTGDDAKFSIGGKILCLINSR
jgi:hypothetical protein